MAPSSGAHLWRPLRSTTCLRALLAALSILTALTVASGAKTSVKNSVKLAFTSNVYNASIFENNLGKEFIISDGDPMGIRVPNAMRYGAIRYKIISGDPDGFFKAQPQVVGDFNFLRVRTRTGHADVLNRERQAKFRLKVRATLRGKRRVGGRQVAFTELHIRVLDRNDLNPWFDNAFYDVEVAEDLPLHGLVTRLHADDADEGVNGEVYYSFEETEPWLTVEPRSGEVRLARRLSHRHIPEINLTAIARDRGLNEVDVPGKARLRVKVRPVNLHAPVMHVTHLKEVVEHSTMDVYAIVKVTDEDEGSHGRVRSVRIVDGDPGRLFRVVPGHRDGEYWVGVSDALDRESAPYGFNLTLNATDAGTPPRSSLHSVRVRVMDFNDHAPAFTQESYAVSVRETAPPHTNIVQLRAQDRDWGVNARVTYAIAAGNEGGEFGINANTGRLWLARPLDAETKAFYTLTVSALDQQGMQGGRRRQGSARVTISVLDENDNAPRFNTPNTQAAVDENEPAEHYVTRVTAEDADRDENGFLSYSLANTEPVPFTIDPYDGTISTSQTLDFETQRRQYVLRVRVSDWGKPYRWQSETTVTVKLRNVNDNRPQFEKVDCHGYLSRRANIGTEIMVLSAIDFDEGAVVNYRLVKGNEDGCFTLDERLGTLRVGCDISDVAAGERILGVMANDGQHFSDETRLQLQLVPAGSQLVAGAGVRLQCKDTGVAGRFRAMLSESERNNAPRHPFTVLQASRYGANHHRPQLSADPAADIHISEAADIGSRVVTVIGRDKDLGYNGLLVYAISDGDDDSVFDIDQDNGTVWVFGRLDRERSSQYHLNVTACDRGEPQLCSSLPVLVHVQDVNDNAPRLQRVAFTFFYPETRPAGGAVVQLNATDPDQGRNGHVTYHMVTDTSDFSVDSGSGVVTQVAALDRERQSSYRLRVAARDGGVRQRESFATINIDVLDVNDNAPQFSRGVYRVRAAEDLPVGAIVASVDAVDPDRPGDDEPVSYSVRAGGDGRFGIDRRTGAVRLLEPLDFEKRQIYNVTIEAKDDGSPPLTTVAYLVVHVGDVNENYHAPTFGGVVAVSGTVLEGSPPGTFVLEVRATDADPPGPNSDIQYSIRGGNGIGLFTINETGIYTRNVLDRESQASYWLTVYAQDSGAVPLSARLEVYIDVKDINDNYPLPSTPVFRAQVAENSPAGTFVTQVTATDRDGQGPLQYSIAGGNPQSFFNMDTDTGVITTTGRKLDRESQEEFTLQVTVADWGQPALTSTAQVKVTVLDENDCDPAFSEEPYKVDVPLGPVFSRPNAPVFQLVARDADVGANAELRYTIVATDGPDLTIDARSGQLSLRPEAAPLVPGKHKLSVKATDGGVPARSAMVRVLLTVQPAGSAPPYPPRVQLPSTPVQMYETDPVGRLVTLATANATLLFGIAGGNTGGSFMVNSEGDIVVARRLDWETTSEYTLNISATDGHHVVYTPLHISVLDVNDLHPSFDRSVYEANISEAAAPGARVLTVTASDRDREAMLYFQLEAAQNARSLQLFNIDSSTGVVSVAGQLDRETEAEHVLTMSVRDHGTSARRDYARLRLRVRDENDHRPEFLSDLVVGQVHGTAEVGSLVVTLLATDRDHGQNGRITYSILSGNVDNAFRVDPVLGTLEIARKLDPRRVSEYILKVRASDAGEPPLHGDVHVNVVVTVPDNVPPRFEKAEYGAEVEEDWPPGTHVLDVVAHCRAAVSYRLVSGNEDNAFLLNPGAGVLTVNERLDYERRTWYNVSVQAVSTVGEVAYTSVIIHVRDVNDNRPQLEHLSYTGSVRESAPAGSPVLNATGHPLVVRATDRDANDNGRLVYRIVETEAARFLVVDPASGAVRTLAALDHETQPQFQLTVDVWDRGQPRLQATRPARLTVTVVDVNDEPPRFAHTQYNFTVLTPSYDGVEVGRLEAEDPDTKNLSYSLSGVDSALFSLEADSGSLRLVKGDAPPASANITVTASDGLHTASVVVMVISRQVASRGLVFSKPKYYATVRENISRVHTVAALDVRGNQLNEHLAFKILNPSPYFSISRTAGVVRSSGLVLDREQQQQHVLAVQVRSERDGRLAHALLHVSVLDENDNRPVFVSRPYHAVVAVDAPAGTPVIKVRAIDADVGDNGRVHYDLLRGNSDLFSVDPLSGAISLRRSPRGLDTTFRLVVTADDGGKPPLSSEAEVLVTTVHGGQPRFSAAHYRASVPESAAARTPVLTLEAAVPSPAANSQAAAADSLVFQLTDDSDASAPFDVDFNTGVLYVSSELDYESRRQYDLSVTATDRVTGAVTAVPVTVDVTDVNDNAPQLEKSRYNVSVKETAHPGTRLLILSATDRDQGGAVGLSYRVQEEDGTDSAALHVTVDGHLVVTSFLDHESRSQHHLLVTVSDDGSPPLTGTASLTVNVEDVNDNVPVFERERYVCQLTELPSQSQFVTMVRAHDPDPSDRLRYSLTDGNDQQRFYIDAHSGVMTVSNMRAFESEEEYVLQVTVSDGVHHTSVPMTVVMLPENRHEPAFERVAYEVDLPEDAPSGALVTQVHAVDPDRGHFGEVTYGIPSTLWSETFAINATTGEIRMRRRLDRETQPVLMFSVRASDGGHRSDHSSVRVRLRDVNDNAPRFQLGQYRVSVPANMTAGDVVCRVTAYDPDEGDNARLTYTIYESESSDIRRALDVNSETGELILMRRPSELESPVYQFFVRATDGGSERLAADVPVDVMVLPDSEGVPVFDRTHGVRGPQSVFLTESDPVGTRITSVRARYGGTVTYSVASVHDSPSMDMFEVDADGRLILAKSLDREVRDRYNVTIAAETDSLPPLVAYTQIAISVIDENDNAPEFDADVYRGTVREGLPAGTRVVQVSAVDPDVGANGQVRYRLSPKSSHLRSVLSVHERSGWVTTLKPLDRETGDTYRLTVVASDQGSPRRSATASLVLTVADADDSAPVFSSLQYMAVVNEDALPRTSIMSLTTSDDDLRSRPVQFYITGGDPSAQFELVSNGDTSGELFVRTPLDRETVASYDLAVTATDGALVTTTTVHIDVLDANDNAPVCEEEEYMVTLSEAAPPQHLLTIRASDADDSRHARLRYYLTGDGADDFTIDPALGHVRVSGTLDRESRPVYHLRAHVQDRGRAEWECTSGLVVRLTDVNDCPPRLPQGVVSLTVPEDTPVNTILGQLRAQDDDDGVSAEVEYSLVDAEEEQLLVDTNSGVITLARPLDREQQPMYNISVRVADRGTPSLSSTAVVILLVQDVNDNAPEFTKTVYHASVLENTTVGTEVLKLLATSRDSGVNAEISYSIIGGNEHNMFQLNAKTGIISVIAELDYERAREYMVTVEARDGGTPPLSNHATVNVTVRDCNDNAPVFSQEVYSAVVQEDVPGRHKLLQVHAADLDAGENRRVRYTVTGGDRQGQFGVDPTSGHLYVATQLDREMVSSYSLEVTATDGGTPALSSSCKVNVLVTDVNDNAPVFSQAEYKAVIQEDKAPGYELLIFTVTDADEDPNAGPFTFDIAEGNTGNWFVVTSSGLLRTAAKFDHRQRDRYRLLVRVYDNGMAARFSETWVTIKIIEEPQYPPVCIPLYVKLQAYQDGFAGGVVGRVHASDQDPYDRLQFSLAASPGMERLFELDPDDGSLVTLAGIDAGLYRLNVTVTDGKFTSQTSVTIEVRTITAQMARNAVALTIGPMTPVQFVMSHMKPLRRALRKHLKVRSKDVEIMSVQPSRGSRRQQRSVDVGGAALDVLLAVRRGAGWMDAALIRRRLRAGRAALARVLGVQVVSVDEDGCGTDPCRHGRCQDTAVFDPEMVVSVSTDVLSFVSPRHSRQLSCSCNVGFGGDYCEELVNECGRAPCPDHQLCVPDTSVAGFACRCPEGRTGPRCQLRSSECGRGQCYTPHAPFSLGGDGVAEYRMLQPADRRFSLSLSLRTRQPTGTLAYAAEGVEYSILEMVNGQVQYRFDCGSGEGLVKVPDMQFNDDRWHNVNVKRFGNRAEVLVDGRYGAQGAAPGVYDVLSIASGLLLVGAATAPGESGAEAPLRRGFSGCLDNLQLDDQRLPLHARDVGVSGRLLRTIRLQAGCGDTLPPPHVCGSHPCQNGGTCSPAPGRPDGVRCVCGERYRGSRCEVDTQPCASSPCLNGGVCTARGAEFRCDCPLRLTGDRCQFGLHCSSNPCLNGGACEDGPFGPICKCRGFTGPSCAVDVNECLQSPCRHGATCINVPGSFRCLCAANWTGTYCGLAASAPASQLPITLEHIVGLVALVLALALVALIVVCWRQSRRKRSRTPRRPREDDASNEILLHNIKPKNQRGTEFKRMSKVSNLDANGSVAATLPARPASFTSGAHNGTAQQYSTLNNLDTIRSYGSAADDLDGPPHSVCQYLQNFNKPTASVAPSMAATASELSASNTLEKSYRDIDKNIKPSYYDTHKIQNDQTDPQLAALNRIQLPPLERARRELPGATALSSPDTPDYHWDCSDWAHTSQNPLPNITEVTGSEVKDTSSYHSNESNESNTAVRPPLVGEDDDVLETLNEDQTSDYMGGDADDDDDITSDLDTLPEPTNFDRILSENGIQLGGSGSELSSLAGAADLAYGLVPHPNLYLPSHSGAETDPEPDSLLHRLDRYRYPARNRRPLQLGTFDELESLTTGSQSEDGGAGQLCDIESDDATSHI